MEKNLLSEFCDALIGWTADGSGDRDALIDTQEWQRCVCFLGRLTYRLQFVIDTDAPQKHFCRESVKANGGGEGFMI